MKNKINKIIYFLKNKALNSNDKSYSLNKNYVYFTTTITLLILMFYIWVGVLNYNKIRSDYNNSLKNQLDIIDSEIVRTFDYISYLSVFLSNQVVQEYNNLNKIKKIFMKLDHNYRKLNLPPISMFTWLNKDKELIISSKHGFVDDSYNALCLKHRNSLYKAAKNPDLIFIDEPTYGSVSGLFLLPVVRSVYDQENLIGFVNIGLSIDGLSKYFENSVNIDKISYIIFSNTGAIISQSSKHKTKIPNKFFVDNFVNGNIQGPITFNNVEYDLIKKSSKYPIFIAVGYYPDVIWHEIKNGLSLQVAPFALICILFVIIVYEFKQRLFEPLFSLTKCADRIAKGELNIEIPKIEIIELNNFATQLGKIKSYINEIIEIENMLLAAKQEAERSNNAKSQFLANMSHELRTPLFTVTGYAEAIKEEIYGPVSSEYKIAADNIVYAGKHLLELINDILDLSKAESGTVMLEEEYINIANVIDVCVNLTTKMALDKNIKFTKKLDYNFSEIYVDALRFRQIILNLLSNAIKFSHQNGEIKIKLYKDINSNMVLSIKDNGIGMTKDDISVAVSEFGQVKNAYARSHLQGTGLGLPMAIKFTKLHGGFLDIISEPGLGTEVLVTIPKNRIKI